MPIPGYHGAHSRQRAYPASSAFKSVPEISRGQRRSMKRVHFRALRTQNRTPGEARRDSIVIGTSLSLVGPVDFDTLGQETILGTVKIVERMELLRNPGAVEELRLR